MVQHGDYTYKRGQLNEIIRTDLRLNAGPVKFRQITLVEDVPSLFDMNELVFVSKPVLFDNRVYAIGAWTHDNPLYTSISLRIAIYVMEGDEFVPFQITDVRSMEKPVSIAFIDMNLTDEMDHIIEFQIDGEVIKVTSIKEDE